MSTASPHAAILVFAYKRAEHLRRCLDSLTANPEAQWSDIIIHCDGPRTAADSAAVDRVRSLVNTVRGFKSVTVLHRDQNAGLARSIIEGVTKQLENHEQVIVVEDDLLLSKGFLGYMNAALNLYAHDSRVASVHGYCYPVGSDLPETFFLRGADCWGWSTWRRAWSTFRKDGAELLNELRQRKLIDRFDLDGAYSFSGMLEDQIAGRNDSWAVRWHASCFLNEMYTLYPGRSLVQNIGNDATGSHSKSTTKFDVGLRDEAIVPTRIVVDESSRARHAFVEFLAKSSLRNRLSHSAFRLRSLVGAIR